MPAANDRKIVLVTRRTRLEDLIARYLTPAQARFYVEHLGADFSDYEREHEVYQAQRHATLQVLEQWGRYQVIERGFLPNFIFAPDDIVVALGQDGVVANTMKYLDGHPLIGVNPEPARHDGILLPFAPGDLAKLLPDVAAEKRDSQAVTMAEARLSDGQVLHAVNDLFVGARTHVSAVYEIAAGGTTERQSSSGLIVSTGLGSTAWFKSIVTGSLAIAGSFGQPSPPASYDALPWDAAELRFAVREPFPSRHSQTNLVCGRLASEDQLRIRSLMAENGVIFSDGVEADRLDFNAGAEVTIGIAARRGRLIV
ncbi:sugar kinase [Bradyrhizobium sp. KB893862 SZCCT0404]|uniref:sugar kinase n=1 Tax=Bradyrhizobium sp. KB893862 SZCCT0404 TaxID=2807672 RepID=UPI001BA6D868|nr:sugar kinase [Bradyrhizobium sp. KB893862 SZCCT0404]MBR1172826.1 sugar kinase [Bradyrhizobium sp. KB893862 SZCCT0404]